MKKLIVFILSLAVVGTLAMPSAAQTQSESLPIGGQVEIDLGDSVLSLERKPKPTKTSTPAATSTSVPTTTPIVIQTFTPSPTSAGAILPFAAAPYCPDNHESHDTTTWHSDWDYERGCKYAHEHGQDPNDMRLVAVFGVIGEELGSPGQVFGSPWGTSALENVVHMNGGKHEMNKVWAWIGNEFPLRDYTTYRTADGSVNGDNNNCVTHARVRAHGSSMPLEALTAIHSFEGEFRIASKESNCTEGGTIFVGGHLNYLEFRVPFYSFPTLRPGGTFSAGGLTATLLADDPSILEGRSGEPYWQAPQDSENARYIASRDDNRFGDQWSSNEPLPMDADGNCSGKPAQQAGNCVVHLAFRVRDGSALFNPDDVNNPHIICSQYEPMDCSYNATMRLLGEVHILIDPRWDGAAFDTDPRVGFVSFSRFTDRWQRFNDSCTAASLDCVPMILDGAPTGYAAFNFNMGNAPLDRYYNGSECEKYDVNCVWFAN